MSTHTPSESDSTGGDEGQSPWSPSESTVQKGEDLGYPDPPGDNDLDLGGDPRRDNWYGDPEVETAADQHHEHGTEWTADEIQDDKAESVAWTFLRGIAPKLCGASVDDPAQTPTELSDPDVYPHGSGNRDHLRQARINEDLGTISGGESTGVRLGDVSEQEFLSIVEVLLDHWQHIGHITDEVAEKLYSDAQSMKAKSDIKDKEAIERLVTDALQNKDFAAVVDMMLSTWRKAGNITADESNELMVEAIRLQNQPTVSEEDVIDTLAERALPLPVSH